MIPDLRTAVAIMLSLSTTEKQMHGRRVSRLCSLGGEDEREGQKRREAGPREHTKIDRGLARHVELHHAMWDPAGGWLHAERASKPARVGLGHDCCGPFNGGRQRVRI